MASKESVHSGKRKAHETDKCRRNVRSRVSDSAQSNVDWQSTKKTVSERTRRMFNNPEMSDISFTCEGSDKTFYAHKYVLATSSVVFKTMFYGVLVEKNPVIYLSDTDEKSLKEFLRFLYTDGCDLTADNVMSVIYLSKKYIVPSLTKECVNFLKDVLEPENVLTILEQAMHFDEKELEKKSWEVFDRNTGQVVTLESFNHIKYETLACLLKRGSLDISELALFKAVLRWSDSQCSRTGLDPTAENRRSVIGDSIYDLRFLAMKEREFAENIVRTGLLTTEEVVSIYNTFNGVGSPNLKWTVSKKRANLAKLTADIAELRKYLNEIREYQS